MNLCKSGNYPQAQLGWNHCECRPGWDWGRVTIVRWYRFDFSLKHILIKFSVSLKITLVFPKVQKTVNWSWSYMGPVKWVMFVFCRAMLSWTPVSMRSRSWKWESWEDMAWQVLGPGWDAAISNLVLLNLCLLSCFQNTQNVVLCHFM